MEDKYKKAYLKYKHKYKMLVRQHNQQLIHSNHFNMLGGSQVSGTGKQLYCICEPQPRQPNI